jgi:hypothetical protein
MTLATALTLIMMQPAFAASDEADGGFGGDYFTGKEHPAFEDPSFFDIDSLTKIEPSAGEDTTPVEEETEAPAVSGETPEAGKIETVE